MTEVWFRDPHNYVREMVDVGANLSAWERGTVVKRGIDVNKFMDLHFRTTPYRMLLIGEQGTAELDHDHTIGNPKAVYPTWTCGQSAALLEEWIANPVGEDEQACSYSHASTPIDEIPVLGQEHRVVIRNIPPANTWMGKKMIQMFADLQEEYPECILHIHGLYSFRMAFGMKFGSADIEVRQLAQKGKVVLPTGKEVTYETTANSPQWVTMFGYLPTDLSDPKTRCTYNIRSAMWAGDNFDSESNIRQRKQPGTNTSTSSQAGTVAPISAARLQQAQPGDKVTCDTCSLADHCGQYRAGAACSLPEEGVSLTRMFNTRDPERILDGLSKILSINGKRAERELESEEIVGELSPEATKLLNQMFSNGIKFAKLASPERFGPKSLSIGITLPGGAAPSNNPQQLVSAFVRQLEERGIPRENITPEMLQNLLSGGNQRVIEGSIESGEIYADPA